MQLANVTESRHCTFSFFDHDVETMLYGSNGNKLEENRNGKIGPLWGGDEISGTLIVSLPEGHLMNAKLSFFALGTITS